MKRSKLSYTVPAAKGFEAVGDAMFHMMGKRGTAEWRRACAMSLRASRRRRGLDPDVGAPRPDVEALAAIYEVPPNLMVGL